MYAASGRPAPRYGAVDIGLVQTVVRSEGEAGAETMGRLGSRPHGQPAASVLGHTAARLERDPGDALIHQAQANDASRARERAFDDALAPAPAQDDVVGELGVDPRRSGRQR